ncbi:hypothetical protein [Chromobacterium haemolyticum]|uniref:hypothetical protein n=1 Tax=Chromobacterium haemolyticum TaxID=394935 RepID=UPI0005927B86|nr:hypothetical protein [Chromobacterium haemolyticum]
MVNIEDLNAVKAKIVILELTLSAEREAMAAVTAQRDVIAQDFKESISEVKRLNGALIEKSLLCENLLFANTILNRHAIQLMADNMMLKEGKKK